MKIDETTAIAFIRWHVPEIAATFGQPEYAAFCKLVAEGKDIAAAEEYDKLNNTTIAEAHFAVSLAKELGVGRA